MSVQIELETIGEQKGWIAELAPADNREGFTRKFIGNRDYSRANKPRTRGVYTVAEMDSGRVYEINDPRSWGRTERYFATVRAGEIVRIAAGEMKEILRAESNPST